MKKANEISVTVKLDPEGLIHLLEMIRESQQEALDNTNQMIANLKTDHRVESKDPEVRLVEQSAIPAAYYMRDSVQEAIKAEVIRDIKAGQTCPPGFELIKSEEESTDGETEKISSSENDINDGGDGPESPGDGENDGSQNSGGGEDHPGDTAQDPNNSGKGPKTRGKK